MKKASAKIAIKLLLIALALYFLSQRLQWEDFHNLEIHWHRESIIYSLLLFVLAWFSNILLDAQAWRLVESMVKPLTLRQALMHNLKCYGLAFVTPVNSGELAGRYLVQDEPAHRRYAVFLTFWTHAPKLFSKMLVSWPLIALWLQNRGQYSLALLVMLAWLIVLLLYFRLERVISLLHEKRLFRRPLKSYMLRGLPRWPLKARLLLINAGRFLIFSGQMVLVLSIFKSELLSIEIFGAIPVYYFLTAIIPSYASFDFLIKGTVSLYFFGLFSESEIYFFLASTMVWLFNLALPALVGLTSLRSSELARLKRKRS